MKYVRVINNHLSSTEKLDGTYYGVKDGYLKTISTWKDGKREDKEPSGEDILVYETLYEGVRKPLDVIPVDMFDLEIGRKNNQTLYARVNNVEQNKYIVSVRAGYNGKEKHIGTYYGKTNDVKTDILYIIGQLIENETINLEMF